MQTRLIAVTGGIGSGKSVVSTILRALGYDVYDCDSRAKSIVDRDPEIKTRIRSEISADCVDAEGNVRRDRLAEIVFADSSALSRLNSIVHSAVRSDLRRRAAESDSEVLFVETAILYQSDIDLMVDEVWGVVAPEELRVARVISRNGLSRAQVKARIEAQDSFISDRRHKKEKEIINDEILPVLPQIEGLIKSI